MKCIKLTDKNGVKHIIPIDSIGACAFSPKTEALTFYLGSTLELTFNGPDAWAAFRQYDEATKE